MRKNLIKQFTVSLLLVVNLVFLIASCKKDNVGGAGQSGLGSAGPLTILPNSGAAGTLVTISGNGFSTNPANNTVTFNGKQANIVSANASQLIVQAPEGGATGAVEVSAGGKPVSAGTYTYQTLSIHGIEPVNGPSGTNILIMGAGFGSITAPAQVTVNGKAAKVISAADTLLIAAVPTNSGTGPVVVNVNGQTATGPIFTYQEITGINPLTGGPGTVVTITGIGFNTTATQNTVAFNGVNAVVNSATATTITATLQTGVTTGPVSVTINGQRTLGPVFTVVPQPLITGLAPNSGPAGVQVTLSGNYFSTALAENQVSFNGVTAAIVSVTGTKIVVIAPAGVTTGAITVTTNNQKTKGPVFTAQSLGIGLLSPDNGLDGTVVTISGTGFSTTASQNLVYFNGKAATVTSATATSLVVTVPAGSTTGPVTIKANGLNATGPVFTHAGVVTLAGGPNSSVFNNYMSVPVVDKSGNVFIADYLNNKVLKITQDGTVSIFAGSTTGATGLQNGTGTDALFNGPYSLTMDSQGNLLVADLNNDAIREITPGGVVSTYKTLTYQPSFLAIDAQGVLYVGGSVITKYLPNGISTQVTNQQNRYGFAVDASGNLYYGGAYDLIIHKVNPAGVDTRFAGTNYGAGFIDGAYGIGRFNNVTGIAIDPTTQNLIITDSYGTNAIRMVTAANGALSTITGGGNYTGQSGYQDGGLSTALFGSTTGVAVDQNGNIYVMDTGNTAIRKIGTH